MRQTNKHTWYPISGVYFFVASHCKNTNGTSWTYSTERQTYRKINISGKTSKSKRWAEH